MSGSCLRTGDLLQVNHSSLFGFMETWPPIGGEGESYPFVQSDISLVIVSHDTKRTTWGN